MTNYITKGIGGFYYVKTETGIVECRARGIFRKRGITPVAGDQVVLSADRTTIDEILPRKNVFIRPPVANLDVLFIVASTTQPVPSTLILDELTAAAVYKDVQPVIVITKARPCRRGCLGESLCGQHDSFDPAGLRYRRRSGSNSCAHCRELVCILRQLRCGQVYTVERAGSSAGTPDRRYQPKIGPWPSYYP